MPDAKLPVLPDVEFLDGHISAIAYIDANDAGHTFEQIVKEHGLDNALLALSWKARKAAVARCERPHPGSVFISYRRSSPSVEALVSQVAATLRSRGYEVNLDLENPPAEFGRAIPQFVARISHCERILVLHGEGFAIGRDRTWIREERRAALVAALAGEADIFIGRLDASPLSDPWMGYFPSIELAEAGKIEERIAQAFPHRASDYVAGSDLAPVVYGVLEADGLHAVSGEVRHRLANTSTNGLPLQLAKDLAFAREILKIATEEDRRLLRQIEERRIEIASFVGKLGHPADAIRYLQPSFRRGGLQWQSHRMAAKILEEQCALHGPARNHYCAAARLAGAEGNNDAETDCSLAALRCAAIAWNGLLHPLDRQRVDFPVPPATAPPGEGGAGKKASVPDHWLICLSCFSAYGVDGARDRICACCSYTRTLSEAEAKEEDAARQEKPLQPKILDTAKGPLCLEVKGLPFRCSICQYPGIVPWQATQANPPLHIGCPLCGTGRLITAEKAAIPFLVIERKAAHRSVGSWIDSQVQRVVDPFRIHKS